MTPQRFNDSVNSYHRLLSQKSAQGTSGEAVVDDVVRQTTDSATSINSRVTSTTVRRSSTSSFLYLLAFAILCLGWLKWRITCNRVAFWLLVCTFVVHTLRS